MLALPRLGCINLHASLLPKYRGAAPIQWAVAMGETVTGNTTMLLEEGLDTGPILLQQTVEIGPEQTAADLFECWPSEARRWWWRRWQGWGWERSAAAAGSLRARRWLRCCSARMGVWILRRARRRSCRIAGADFSPGPGAFTMLDGKKLIVHRMAVAEHA